jgi:hypothetical protein
LRAIWPYHRFLFGEIPHLAHTCSAWPPGALPGRFQECPTPAPQVHEPLAPRFGPGLGPHRWPGSVTSPPTGGPQADCRLPLLMPFTMTCRMNVPGDGGFPDVFLWAFLWHRTAQTRKQRAHLRKCLDVGHIHSTCLLAVLGHLAHSNRASPGHFQEPNQPQPHTCLSHWHRGLAPGSGLTGGQSLAQACTEPIAAADAIHYDIMIITSPHDGSINTVPGYYVTSPSRTNYCRYV